jgi:hypothetical protein
MVDRTRFIQAVLRLNDSALNEVRTSHLLKKLIAAGIWLSQDATRIDEFTRELSVKRLSAKSASSGNGGLKVNL